MAKKFKILQVEYPMVQRRLYIALTLLFFNVVIGTLGYFVLFKAKAPMIDCLYMTIVTLSTVGYGEILDVSNNNVAKVFTMFLMICGIGFLFYNFSLMTAFMVEGELSKMWRDRKMKQKIAKLTGHYIICGGGETGTYALEELLKIGMSLVLIENSEDKLEKYADCDQVLYIQGDCTEDEILLQAGIERAQGIVVVLPSDKDNLFITVTARQMSASIRIVAKGVGPKMQAKLLKAGANSVVCPNAIGGMRMASEMVRPTVVTFLDVMLRDSHKTIRIEEIHVRSGSEFIGKTLAESGLKKHYDLLVLATMASPIDPTKVFSSPHYNPPANQVIQENTVLIVLGSLKQVQKVQKISKNS